MLIDKTKNSIIIITATSKFKVFILPKRMEKFLSCLQYWGDVNEEGIKQGICLSDSEDDVVLNIVREFNYYYTKKRL